MAQGESVLNGSINLQGEEPVFDLDVETAGVRAEPFIKVVAPEVKLTGNVNNIMFVKGTLTMPDIRGRFC